MFLANGMDDFLPKPIEKARLIEILRQWVPENLMSDKPDPRAGSVQNTETASAPEWKIDGISFESGLDKTGGIETLYYQALDAFFKTIHCELEKLCHTLEENDLRGFSIIIH